MSKYTCKDLSGRSFETKSEMFSALKESKAEIIALKKSAIKYSEAVSLVVKEDGTVKQESSAKLQYGDFIYPVINTTAIWIHTQMSTLMASGISL